MKPKPHGQYPRNVSGEGGSLLETRKRLRIAWYAAQIARGEHIKFEKPMRDLS